jgi:oligopeptide/dipeptide ABC transporter ATP-binding protein
MPEPLLEVSGLHMHFPLGTSLVRRARRIPPEVLRAVDGVDLRIAQGEVLGLVGESGCGKSTLGRCIVGIYQPTAGQIRFRGEPLKGERSERRHMQIVFQDPYSSLNPRMTVQQALIEVMRVHGIVEPGRVRDRCRELVDLVGLGQRSLDAFPRQLSGGQRQRVSIARALALEPDLLVADEPVSALDVSVQANVLNLLESLRERLGLTMLFIAHNLAVVRHVCDRVAVMYLGRIVEEATTDEVFANPRHPYTQGLLKAIPRLVPGRASQAVAIAGDPPSPIRLPRGCRFHPRCPIAQQICHQLDPALSQGSGSPTHTAACHFAWTGQPARHAAEVELDAGEAV